MEIYLVGGAVRDQLLNYPVYDKDWVVVGATPQEMLDQGYTPVGSDFPVFLHPESKEEYALARTERKSGKGYKGFQYFASPDVTLEQDLIRRDLTINAMAQSVLPDGTGGDIIDPYHGKADLQKKVLRHVSDAFIEDPLRVLRVARFAARYAHLGFTIAEETLTLMSELSESDELAHLANERVWQEVSRALMEQTPLVFFEALNQVGASQKLFPVFENLSNNPTAEMLTSQFTKDSDSAVRFATLCWVCLHSKDDALDEAIKLSEALRVPNLHKELLQHTLISVKALSHWADSTAEERLDLIKSIDLIRRPERLKPLEKALRLVNSTGLSIENPLESLPDLVTELRSINPKELMKEGFKGAELGEAIKQRQLSICSRTE